MSEPDEYTKRLTKIVAFFMFPEGKQPMKALKEGDNLTLKREPENPADPNAIGVWVTLPNGGEVQLGYVPAIVAANIRHARLGSAFKHPSAWDAIIILYKA